MGILLPVLIVANVSGVVATFVIQTGWYTSDELWAIIAWSTALTAVLTAVLVAFGWIVGRLWHLRWRVPRQVFRILALGAFPGLTAWAYLTARAEYAAELAAYDPSEDCRVLLGTCEPADGRILVLLIFALAGLLAVAWTRRRGRRLRDWCSDCGEPLVSHPAVGVS